MRYELTDDESAGTQERASTIGDQTGHSDRITRANIDRFLNRLESENDGSILHKMILAEELARDTEHLEFAESRTLGFRERYDRLANWRDSLNARSCTSRSCPRRHRGAASRLVRTRPIAILRVRRYRRQIMSFAANRPPPAISNAASAILALAFANPAPIRNAVESRGVA